MTLIRTSLLNAIAVFIKMLTLLGINKVLAIYVGPSGYAALGQFQNAVQMITTFASGAVNTGVTKYTAEYKDDVAAQHRVWRTAGTIALSGSLFFSVLIVIFNETLAIWFLKDVGFGGVFVWFGTTLVLFTLNTLMLAILNGKKEIGKYVIANIAGSLFSLLVTALMSMSYGLYGALVALAVYQSLSCFITFFLCLKSPWFKLSYMIGTLDKKTAINLSKFTVMALSSALCVPISHILVRNHLGETFGWQSAGYWEAMWRLSSAYLMLVTTTLSVYYLPKLSELKESKDIKNEILQGYKVIFPVAIACGLIMYFLRDFIISVLFTSDFLPMRDLFGWQMLGDVLKIASWILGYVLAARAYWKIFVFSELFFALLFYVLVVVFSSFELESAVIAHAVTYALHFCFMFAVMKKKGIFA
ncbi:MULTISPECIES: O-antigen translocase [Pseudomonas]|uniref:Polysaccharide biosynthesis protein n=1 Tax=Pseudomonas fluorescens LMG 5329 TaxID=1324332 RepID=A0A0A1Z6R9_PSEFL|nr:MULTISPECIES: O-antigen translocase [Pseudomonas]KGE68477.1 polysaccharide biosynthesis protein [Pseudomonas fluorescens LMG 5329]NWE02243.1 O-antigen translocase [Pseudomonas sp. IPO3749]NWF22014.1 O-antigen translocase [Pseudomonas sp. IPO3749]